MTDPFARDAEQGADLFQRQRFGTLVEAVVEGENALFSRRQMEPEEALDERALQPGVGHLLDFTGADSGHALAECAGAAAIGLIDRRIDPGMSEVFAWEQIPEAHEKMLDNAHQPGNMAVLVTAPRTGLRTLEDVIEAGRALG